MLRLHQTVGLSEYSASASPTARRDRHGIERARDAQVVLAVGLARQGVGRKHHAVQRVARATGVVWQRRQPARRAMEVCQAPLRQVHDGLLPDVHRRLSICTQQKR